MRKKKLNLHQINIIENIDRLKNNYIFYINKIYL